MTSMPSLEPDLAVAVTTPKSPLLKRLLLLTAAIAALVFIGLYAAHWWTAGRFIEETDDAYIGGDVTVIGAEGRGLHRRGDGQRQPESEGRRCADPSRFP